MAVSERFQGASVVDAGRLSPYWGEHTARYLFAQPFVEKKRILDIACGTGYGLAILKRSATLVAGVDVDITAARVAKGECDERTTVVLGDGCQIPFADNSFDVVTSFETLEHLQERSRFLAELRRVMCGGGTLILSTPNASYTKPVNGKPSNPFHIFEYSPAELLAELEVHFKVLQFLGQTLDPQIQIPPFQDAQRRLPKRLSIQTKLIGWKVMNKIPIGLREWLSGIFWNKPFYPTEADYMFSVDMIESAPVLVAVCRKI